MASSGELIRMMNYVDDISTTLRRIAVGSGPPWISRALDGTSRDLR